MQLSLDLEFDPMHGLPIVIVLFLARDLSSLE
jgi:hypothetical protein